MTPEFDVKYATLVDIIQSWTSEYIDINSADVLDFGCGEAITALGFALRADARSVTAVDIGPEVHSCLRVASENIGIESLPSNLNLLQIGTGTDFCPARQFDLVYTWSTFEHVSQELVRPVLAQLRSKVRPNGYLFIQVAPLYYAADGSHLMHKIPQPWAHLTMQDNRFREALDQACTDRAERDALWSTYSTLNKMTAPELKSSVIDSGFEIVREYYTENENVGEPSDELLNVYNRDVLVTNQIVLLARPAPDV